MKNRGVLPFLFIIFVLLNLSFGSVKISIIEVLKVLLGLSNDAVAKRIIFDLRLPRVVSSMIVGSGLACIGNTFQGLLKNPLIDPYLLGIFGTFWFKKLYILNFLFAILASFIPLMIAKRGKRVLITELVLAGVVIGTLFSSATILLIVLSRRNITHISTWLFGSFSGLGWDDVTVMVIPALIFIAISYAFWNELNAMALGEEEAMVSGVNTERLKVFLYIIGSLTTAFFVSRTGAIGFIGLIVPHMARRIVGANYKHSIPASAMIGGIILPLCDTLSRSLFSPTELPVGVITALLGAPMMIFLLKSGVKNV
ncbi:MAG: iron ABC transporter [Thermotoga sp. 4484_232]|nr:MAG: iron ABC transporter [Thermotoga sp. 4484_232]